MHPWHERLDRANDVEHVVGIARRFVKSYLPAQLRSIPDEYRPDRIRSESDIDFWNVQLAEGCRGLWGTDRDGRVLTELSQFFLHASLRLSQLNEASQRIRNLESGSPVSR